MGCPAADVWPIQPEAVSGVLTEAYSNVDTSNVGSAY